MIGENPDSFASWITGGVRVEVKVAMMQLNSYSPYCPTEDEPPRTTIGFPAYFPLPPSHGAISFSGPFLSPYKAIAAAARAKGIEAA